VKQLFNTTIIYTEKKNHMFLQFHLMLLWFYYVRITSRI